MIELVNLCLFALFLAKLSLICGFAPGMALAFLYVQVSGRAVSRGENRTSSSSGHKPVRDVLARAA